MKRFEKASLGCTGALLLTCLVAGALFLLSDRGSAFLGRNSELLAKGRALTALDREFPFPETPPESVSEARVEAFLAAACASREQADRAAAWVRENGRTVVMGQTVFPQEGAVLMGAYLDALTAALREQRMSAAEYLWMGERLFLVSGGPPPADRLAQLRAALESLRAEEEQSRSERRERRRLRRQIEAIQGAAEIWSAGEEADWALYRRHDARLRTCAPSGAALRLLGEYYTPPAGTVLRFRGEPLGDAGPDRDAAPSEEDGPSAPPAPPSGPDAPSAKP